MSQDDKNDDGPYILEVALTLTARDQLLELLNMTGESASEIIRRSLNLHTALSNPVDKGITSNCAISWEKVCGCKGVSDLPSIKDVRSTKVTGTECNIKIKAIVSPLCNKCGKPWTLTIQ